MEQCNQNKDLSLNTQTEQIFQCYNKNQIKEKTAQRPLTIHYLPQPVLKCNKMYQYLHVLPFLKNTWNPGLLSRKLSSPRCCLRVSFSVPQVSAFPLMRAFPPFYLQNVFLYVYSLNVNKIYFKRKSNFNAKHRRISISCC